MHIRAYMEIPLTKRKDDLEIAMFEIGYDTVSYKINPITARGELEFQKDLLGLTGEKEVILVPNISEEETMINQLLRRVLPDKDVDLITSIEEDSN